MFSIKANFQYTMSRHLIEEMIHKRTILSVNLLLLLLALISKNKCKADAHDFRVLFKSMKQIKCYNNNIMLEVYCQLDAKYYMLNNKLSLHRRVWTTMIRSAA